MKIDDLFRYVSIYDPKPCKIITIFSPSKRVKNPAFWMFNSEAFTSKTTLLFINEMPRNQMKDSIGS